MDPIKEETRAENQNIRSLIRDVIGEFMRSEQQRAEPAYKAELVDERRRREELERKVNTLVEENQRSRQLAEELERTSIIRTELQRLGVGKVDLAFKAVKDDIVRLEDGNLAARTGAGEMGLKDYLAQFVKENPELLPARVSGGSGASGAPRASQSSGGPVDLDRIRVGMSAEELERVRREIARVAAEGLRGQ